MGGGGSPCRLSILRNGNVACLCRVFVPMSHVKFKKWQRRMSLPISVPCRMSLSLIDRLLILRKGRVAVSNLGVEGHKITGVMIR